MIHSFLLLTGVLVPKTPKKTSKLTGYSPNLAESFGDHLQYQFDDLTWDPNKLEPSWSPTGWTMGRCNSHPTKSHHQLFQKSAAKHKKQTQQKWAISTYYHIFILYSALSLSTNPTHYIDLLCFHRGPNPSIDFLQPRPMPPLNIGIFHSSIPWFQNVLWDGPHMCRSDGALTWPMAKV